MALHYWISDHMSLSLMKLPLITSDGWKMSSTNPPGRTDGRGTSLVLGLGPDLFHRRGRGPGPPLQDFTRRALPLR